MIVPYALDKRGDPEMFVSSEKTLIKFDASMSYTIFVLHWGIFVAILF